MSHVLAIDLGSSALKVAVVDREGRVAASAGAPLPMIFTPDGGAEQDAEQWWTAAGECSRRAIADAGLPAGAIEAVAVTAQWMSIVAVDRAGRPLMNTVMWMDGRGYQYQRDLARDAGARDLWRERHGLTPTGYDDLGHIAVIRHERPDVYEAAAAFVEPVDYLNARLCGRITATQTTAFPLELVDNRVHGTTTYDDDLVARAGVDAGKLPPLVPYDEILGPVTPDAAEHLGVTTDAVVVTGTMDSITSAVGCGVLDRTTCAVIIGTTTVIVTHVDAKLADPDQVLMSAPSPLPDRYFVVAENGVGGKALDAVLENIVFGDDPLAVGPMPTDRFERAEAAARGAAAGSGGVLFQPWFMGSGAPVADVFMRAGFLNLNLTTTRADLVRAVYEGVAFNAAWLLPHVAALAEASWPAIRFGGGAAASDLWAQILADAVGAEVEQLDGPRTTNARGAAFLALVRLGHISLDDIPAMLKVRGRYVPDPDVSAQYARLVERHVDFHTRNRPFYAALNRGGA